MLGQHFEATDWKHRPEAKEKPFPFSLPGNRETGDAERFWDGLPMRMLQDFRPRVDFARPSCANKNIGPKRELTIRYGDAIFCSTVNFKTSRSGTVTYMARIATVVIPGLPYHVTQRSNRREDVFFGEANWQRYWDFVLEYSIQLGLQILAYCLMTNHLHAACFPRYLHLISVNDRILHTLFILLHL
jgi:hypothetical protein